MFVYGVGEVRDAHGSVGHRVRAGRDGKAGNGRNRVRGAVIRQVRCEFQGCPCPAATLSVRCGGDYPWLSQFDEPVAAGICRGQVLKVAAAVLPKGAGTRWRDRQQEDASWQTARRYRCGERLQEVHGVP